MRDRKIERERRLWEEVGSKVKVREGRKNCNNMKQRKKTILKMARGKEQWTVTERNITA